MSPGARESATRMHADELALDEQLVRRLLEQRFPQWAHLPLEPVRPLGTDNALFRLGSDLVVRLPRRERTVSTLEKELEWLPELAPRLPIPVPVPLCRGEPALEYPFAWAVYPWLAGETAQLDRLGDPQVFAADLAGFVSSLRSVDAHTGPPPGAHNFFRGEPLRHRDDAVRSGLAQLGSAVDAKAVIAVWESALAAPEWAAAPVWIHGDLDSRNLLVRRGRLAGVIDFGCLGVGDPACDVMAAWKVFPAEVREQFRSLLDVDDATWSRARGWALSQAVGALSYYTRETNPTLVAEGERWLAAALAG